MGKASRAGVGDCPKVLSWMLGRGGRWLLCVGGVGEGLAELAAVEVGVGAVPGQQLVVGPAFGDAAGLHYQDPVGVADGGEAVRYHDARASREQPSEGRLYRG